MLCSGGQEGEEEGSSEGKLYDLFAVTNHYGRLGFGHYTSFARDWRGMYATHVQTENDAEGLQDDNTPGEPDEPDKPDGWIECEARGDGWHSFDDNDVCKMQAKDVKTRAAYILFYRKRPPNCIPHTQPNVTLDRNLRPI